MGIRNSKGTSVAEQSQNKSECLGEQRTHAYTKIMHCDTYNGKQHELSVHVQQNKEEKQGQVVRAVQTLVRKKER